MVQPTCHAFHGDIPVDDVVFESACNVQYGCGDHDLAPQSQCSPPKRSETVGSVGTNGNVLANRSQIGRQQPPPHG